MCYVCVDEAAMAAGILVAATQWSRLAWVRLLGYCARRGCK